MPDYFARRAPWQRRLWNPGSVLAIREVAEAVGASREGAIKQPALQDLAAEIEAKVGRDPGLGNAGLRRHLQKSLRNIQPTERMQEELDHISQIVEAEYLSNWQLSLADEPEPEFASRALGSHLLDSGFSPEHLHRWVTALRHDQHEYGLSDLLEEACALVERPDFDYEVLIPMRSMPGPLPDATSEWLDPAEAGRWLATQAADPPGVRHNGGFLFRIPACRDPWTAVEQASDLVESMQARVTLGYPGRASFEPLDRAWVAGKSDGFGLDRPRRQVDVISLRRSERVYDTGSLQSFRLRSALDLLAPLEISAPGAAISGGWAAIEALLSEPGEANARAADHLGLLVACSYPRAELTTLAYRYRAEHDDETASRIDECDTNMERATVLIERLQEAPIALGRTSDAAAAERMLELISDPQPTLERVRSYATEAFRRLYRQRNLALHHGNLESVAMTTTLRTAPALVGAGVDRIVHAALDNPSTSPRALVARANVALSMLERSDPGALVRLLEPR